MKHYNKKLDELFDRWLQVSDKEKFCRDGLMLKYGQKPEYVDEQWEKAPRRVMFLVKDNPDGWGHDTRTWLVEGEQAENSRNLKGGDVGKSGFLPNIAKMLYGLLIISPDNPAALPQTEEGMNKVREVFNTAPFALIEGKKKAGGDNVLKREMEKALEQDKDFLKEEIDILRPNIIVCCDAEDTQFNYITQYYLADREPTEKREYIYDNDTSSCCLWYYDSEDSEKRIAVVKSYHPTYRGKGKEKWKIYERVISPFRALVKKYKI